MKLLLKFSGFDYDRTVVVEWNQPNLKTFPHYGKFDGRYWGAIMFDKDISGQADQIMFMSEHKEAALPFDMNGNQLPVTDLELMFGINLAPLGECECGQKGVVGARHSDWCPRYTKS